VVITVEDANMNDMTLAGRDVDAADIKMKARSVDVFYGDTHAIKDVDVDIKDKTVTAFIGPSGCGKSTFLRCLNRMNDTIDVARVDRRDHARRRGYLRQARRPGAAARQGRHGVPEAQPVPEVDLRQRRLRPAHPRAGHQQGGAGRDRREIAPPRRAVGRGEGPPRRNPARACRAASSSACASRARWPPAPRFS
jgi:hypothetical protein